MQRTSVDMLNLKNERQSDNYMPELSNTVTKPALNGMQLEEAFNIFQERRDRLNTDVHQQPKYADIEQQHFIETMDKGGS